MAGDVLTPCNWRDVVLGAIDLLPQDLRALVGHNCPSAEVVVFAVAREPAGKGETDLGQVVVRCWPTYRHYQDDALRREPDDGQRALFEQENARHPERVSEPFLAIDCPDAESPCYQGYFFRGPGDET